MLYNAKAVTVGIVAFLVVCTSPFWAGFGSSDYTSPKVSLPKDAKECIEDTAFMKAEHMQLLNEWRDQALRQTPDSCSRRTHCRLL